MVGKRHRRREAPRRADDAAPGGGSLGGDGRKRAGRRRRLARVRPRAADRGRSDDRDPGQRQIARHARHAEGQRQGRDRGGGARQCQRDSRARWSRTEEGDCRSRSTGQSGGMKRLVILLAFALPACGLHPLYAGGESGTVASALAQIEVAPIAGKSGYQMTIALRDRLPESGGPAKYRLDVKLDDSIVGLGVTRDDTVTRERRSLRARYQLVDAASGAVLLDATAGSDAGVDVVGSECATRRARALCSAAGAGSWPAGSGTMRGKRRSCCSPNRRSSIRW